MVRNLAVLLCLTVSTACARVGYERITGGDTRDGGSDGALPLAELTSDGPAHQIAWLQHLRGTGDLSVGAITVDPVGRLLIGGWFATDVDFGFGDVSPQGTRDGFVLQLNSDGEPLAVRTFGGDGAEVEVAAVEADGRGIVVGGTFDGTAQFGASILSATPGDDIFVAQLAPDNSAALWVRGYGGASSQELDALSLRPGEIAIGGSFSSVVDLGAGVTAAGGGLYAALLDAGGEAQWVQSASSAGQEALLGIAADASGPVYMVGYTNSALDFGDGPLSHAGDQDAFVASVNADGTMAWAHQYGSNRNDRCASILEDGNDLLAWCSFFAQADFGLGPLFPALGSANDLAFVGLDSSGTTVLSEGFGGPWTETAWDMKRLPSGRLVAVGTFFNELVAGPLQVNSVDGSYDWFVAVFDDERQPLWLSTFGTLENENTRAVWLATGPGDAIYVAVNFADPIVLGENIVTPLGGQDLIVIKLVPL